MEGLETTGTCREKRLTVFIFCFRFLKIVYLLHLWALDCIKKKQKSSSRVELVWHSAKRSPVSRSWLSWTTNPLVPERVIPLKHSGFGGF